MSELSLKTGPEWMDESFFTKVIHSAVDSKAKVLKFELGAGSKNPEAHVGSSMYRAIITYSIDGNNVKTKSVIVKTLPEKHIIASPVFDIEMRMYANGGPLDQINTLLRSVGEHKKINPEYDRSSVLINNSISKFCYFRLIYQSLKPTPVIVLEDLSVNGFEMMTKQVENFEDSKTIFQRLAMFHAASYFLVNEKKADFSNFNHSIFQLEDTPMIQDFFHGSIDTFIEAVQEWPGYESYVPKLKEFRKTFYQTGKRIYSPDTFNVLNHGDFHIKNLMGTKLENGLINDFYMLDFQLSVYASPCVDLYYALYNAISDEDRKTRRDEIIHYYHQEFTSTLEKLGFIKSIPSLAELQQDLLKNGTMEVIKCICFKIFFYMDSANTQIQEVICGGNAKDLKKLIFANESYQKFVKAELPRLVQKGFL
ncbi:unnamed protein product [Diamesa serratosioi]